MRNATPASEPREQRLWWYADPDSCAAYEVTALSCPGYPNSWYIPSIGITAHLHYQLFPTQKAAWSAIKNRLMEDIPDLERKLDHARTMLKRADRGEQP